jgi:vesicle coat complex subunit
MQKKPESSKAVFLKVLIDIIGHFLLEILKDPLPGTRQKAFVSVGSIF